MNLKTLETISGAPFIPPLGNFFFQILCSDFVDESPIKKLQRIRTLKIGSLEIDGPFLDWSNNFAITIFSYHRRITIGGSEWWMLDRFCGEKRCSCEVAINDQLFLCQTFQVRAHRIYFLRVSWKFLCSYVNERIDHNSVHPKSYVIVYVILLKTNCFNYRFYGIDNIWKLHSAQYTNLFIRCINHGNLHQFSTINYRWKKDISV